MHDRIESEPARFYLKNAALIEEWASLKGEVLRLAHDFYSSLVDDLQLAATQVGDDVVASLGEIRRFRQARLSRESWRRDDALRVATRYDRKLASSLARSISYADPGY